MSEPPPTLPPTAPPGSGGPGQELTGRIGKYEILRMLGKGAMGIVYLAHDTVLDRDVALKVMVAGIADDPELKQRFEREARAVAKMTHPNIVTVFDLGNHTDGSPYIAMELLKGQDLAKTMRQAPMPLDRIVSIMVSVLSGLNHAHQSGIVHRDIKPANIFINSDGSVKIMDFGVARLTTASMTGTGNIVGTADYMSPEQVKGAKVDGRSDLFSVGCMFYELVTGRRPFHAENLMAIFYRITHEEPDFSLVPEGPDFEALLPILQKALSKNLDERYKTAYELMVDLRDYLRTHATSASAQHALEGLMDMQPPPTPPPPITGVGTRPPTHPATVRTGGDATEIVAAPGDLRGTARPAAGRAYAPTTAGAGRRVSAAPTVLAPRPLAQPARGGGLSPWLYGLVGAVVVAAAIGGTVLLMRRGPEPTTVPTASAPQPTIALPATPEPTPLPPPPTAAPPPTFAAPQGKGAGAMRTAQAAFAKGQYDDAVKEAQNALRANPDNGEAAKLVENALSGQKAVGRFRAAERALEGGDLDTALREAEAGRGMAPWDDRGPGLITRIQVAQQRQQAQAAEAARRQQRRQSASLIAEKLNEADAALGAGQLERAIALYDEVLAIDPSNQRAGMGKTGALTARAQQQAAATTRPSRPRVHTKSFVSGKTVAQSSETRTARNVPEGFEDSDEVAVSRGTQVAELPGKILFEVRPREVSPGDKYTVTVYLSNQGNASIPLKEMFVTTTVNGRKAGGAIPLQVAEVAPGQKAVLLSQSDLWKEDFTSWAMEVTVRTARGEVYRNQVTWR